MAGFASKAQRDKFYELLEEGKMDMATIRAWEANTRFIANLPDRVDSSDKQLTKGQKDV